MKIKKQGCCSFFKVSVHKSVSLSSENRLLKCMECLDLQLHFVAIMQYCWGNAMDHSSSSLGFLYRFEIRIIYIQGFDQHLKRVHLHWQKVQIHWRYITRISLPDTQGFKLLLMEFSLKSLYCIEPFRKSTHSETFSGQRSTYLFWIRIFQTDLAVFKSLNELGPGVIMP